MAAIKEYNSSLADKGLAASQLGISATEAAASAQERTAGVAVSTGSRIRESLDETGRQVDSGITAVGNAAGAVYKSMIEQPDINSIALNQAKTQAQIHDAWDDALKNSNLNDPTTGTKFLNGQLEDTLDDFVDGAKTKAGRQYAYDEAVRMRAHMFEKTTADMATRAGQAVMVDMDETKNVLSNVVRKDPSSFNTSLQSWKNSISARIASTPGISADTASKLQTTLEEHGAQELAHAAILGTAAQNPAAAQKMLDSGKYDKYIDGTATAAMIKNMDYATRATANFQRAEQERAAQAKSDQATLQYELKARTDPKSVSAVQALQDPNLTRTDAIYIAKMIDREAKPEAMAKVSNAYESALYGRIYADDGDPNKINDGKAIRDAYIQGHLTPTARDNLLKNLDDRKTPEGQAWSSRLAPLLKAVELDTRSNPLMTGAHAFDKSGPDNAYRFQVDLQAKYEDYKRKGKNPLDLLDPSKPDYVWSPKAREPYVQTMQQSLAAGKAALAAGSKPSTPNDGRPESLNGIATLTRNSTGHYRDETTGDIYNSAGTLVRSGAK